LIVQQNEVENSVLQGFVLKGEELDQEHAHLDEGREPFQTKDKGKVPLVSLIRPVEADEKLDGVEVGVHLLVERFLA
jgi:hypothetical protein